jgi:hypothetical protein
MMTDTSGLMAAMYGTSGFTLQTNAGNVSGVPYGFDLTPQPAQPDLQSVPGNFRTLITPNGLGGVWFGGRYSGDLNNGAFTSNTNGIDGRTLVSPIALAGTTDPGVSYSAGTNFTLTGNWKIAEETAIATAAITLSIATGGVAGGFVGGFLEGLGATGAGVAIASGAAGGAASFFTADAVNQAFSEHPFDLGESGRQTTMGAVTGGLFSGALYGVLKAYGWAAEAIENSSWWNSWNGPAQVAADGGITAGAGAGALPATVGNPGIYGGSFGGLWAVFSQGSGSANNLNPYLRGKTPIPGTRSTAVVRAKSLEVKLVQLTGKGTVDWTPQEIAYIKANNELPPRSVVGHHINNVAEYPNWQGDPRNIRLVRGQNANLEAHGGNFQNSTNGPLIDRQALIDAATGGR